MTKQNRTLAIAAAAIGGALLVYILVSNYASSQKAGILSTLGKSTEGLFSTVSSKWSTWFPGDKFSDSATDELN